MVSPTSAKINHRPPGEVAVCERAAAGLVDALVAVGALVALGAAAAFVLVLVVLALLADELAEPVAEMAEAVMTLDLPGVGVVVQPQFAPSKAQAAPVVALG